MFRFLSSLFLSITSLFSGVHAGGQAVMTSQAQQQYLVQNQQTNTSGSTATTQKVYTQDDLLALADNTYANGVLPLGDNKYVTSGPKKGYIYLCHVNTGANEGGAQVAGSWIHGSTWNIKEKISVSGNVSWPNAKFSNSANGNTRTLSGNDLPSHGTGVFPIQSTDRAYQYDKNPNSIKAQSFSDTFPVNPTYADTPSCMGGESGIMLTGVALFNGFDAGYRDAAAHEVQDDCSGHPEKDGEYHYHSLSSCITDVDETHVIGFALDGFPITGPKVTIDKYLTTDNLDECHGITSQIVLDGKQVTMYHYVMTEDFPYSVSCFRGKPTSLQVIKGMMQQQGGQSSQINGGTTGNGNAQGSNHQQPPQAAFTACTSQTTGSSCSFFGPNGTISGTCQTPPGQSSEVCVPSFRPQ